MKKKTKIIIGIVAAMFVIGGISSLGNSGKEKEDPGSVIYTADAATGIDVAATVEPTTEPTIVLIETPNVATTEPITELTEDDFSDILFEPNDEAGVITNESVNAAVIVTGTTLDTATVVDTTTATDAPATPTPEPTATVEPTPVPTPEPVEDAKVFVVYWGHTGNKVHIKPNCSTIKNGVLSGTLDECIAAGHTEGWCGVCSKNWTDEKFLRDGNPYAE